MPHLVLRRPAFLIRALPVMGVIALLAARPALASEPQGTYTVPTRVDLLPSDDTNRRVLAVLTYLRAGPSH